MNAEWLHYTIIEYRCKRDIYVPLLHLFNFYPTLKSLRFSDDDTFRPFPSHCAAKYFKIIFHFFFNATLSRTIKWKKCNFLFFRMKSDTLWTHFRICFKKKDYILLYIYLVRKGYSIVKDTPCRNMWYIENAEIYHSSFNLHSWFCDKFEIDFFTAKILGIPIYLFHSPLMWMVANLGKNTDLEILLK